MFSIQEVWFLSLITLDSVIDVSVLKSSSSNLYQSPFAKDDKVC